MNFKRLLIVLAIGAFGFTRAGFPGMCYALMIFGFGCFLVYTIMDAGNALGNFLRPDPPTVIIQDDGKAIKGHPDIEGTARRHPDPTRPDDTEEWAGLLTTKIERKYRS